MKCILLFCNYLNRHNVKMHAIFFFFFTILGFLRYIKNFFFYMSSKFRATVNCLILNTSEQYYLIIVIPLFKATSIYFIALFTFINLFIPRLMHLIFMKYSYFYNHMFKINIDILFIYYQLFLYEI